MESSDKRGGLKDKIGEYPASNIPPALGWEQLSAGILAGVAERRRRKRAALWLWWSAGAVGVMVAGWWFMPHPVGLGAFPVGLASSAGLGNSNVDSRCISVPVFKNTTSSSIKFDNQNFTHFKNYISNNQEPTTKSNRNSLTTATQVTMLASALPTLPPATAAPEKMIESLSLEEFNSTELVLISLPALPLAVLEKIPNEDSLSLPKPVQPSPRAHWHVEIAGSTNYFNPNYRSVAPDARTPAPYEKPLLGWQTSVRLQRSFNKNWHLAFGLQWQELRYRTHFNQREMVNLYRPGTIDTIFVNQFTGEETYVYRDSVPGVRTRRFQHYNRHTAWQAPIVVGYSIDANRWGLALQVGVNLQLYQRSQGKTLLDMNESLDLAIGDFYDYAFRHSYLVETQLLYRFNANVRIFTRLGWEQYSQNWLQSRTGAIQRPLVWYMGTGLSWEFR